MALSLKTLGTPIGWGLLRKGPRTFGLLGKATPSGLAPFGRADLDQSWAVTAEWGCLRLERLTGEEEVTGGLLVMPTPVSYDYGITGLPRAPEMVRTVFGLLPGEMDQLATALRRGAFPMLGFSRSDLRCSICSGVIPAFWPHLLLSNTPLYGNVICLESFARILVSSLAHVPIGDRVSGLQPVLHPLMKLTVAHRRGVPYTKGMLDLAPTPTLAAK